ncbi:hypothetical protein [Bradyrhizobium sp. STM 3562]|uniref:hypothetical protein n=1 Tax=Bradyrhizobium sp. STM 3562 TaxID=578924 RepID=UPI00388EA087
MRGDTLKAIEAHQNAMLLTSGVQRHNRRDGGAARAAMQTGIVEQTFSASLRGETEATI